MWAYDTGQTEAVHLPLLNMSVTADIHSTIKAVANCSDGEGRVSMNIIKGGIISAIELMTRKVRKKPARIA